MKLPSNFSASATRKTVNPLEEAINGNFNRADSATGFDLSADRQARLNQREATSKNSASDARESVFAGESQSNQEKSSVSPENPAKSGGESQIFNGTAEVSAGSTSTASPSANSTTAKTQARREVKEKFLVSMSKGERSVYKAFCAMQNVSMNHFVMCAMDYFKEDLENGKVSLSAHSYKRKEV